jgi:hypothetical protein
MGGGGPLLERVLKKKNLLKSNTLWHRGHCFPLPGDQRLLSDNEADVRGIMGKPRTSHSAGARGYRIRRQPKPVHQ